MMGRGKYEQQLSYDWGAVDVDITIHFMGEFDSQVADDINKTVDKFRDDLRKIRGYRRG